MVKKTTEVSDEVLMGRAQEDDRLAFAQLYDRHSVRALRMTRSICRDVGRAEDAVQEGFLAVWRSRMKFRPESGNFRSWSMKMIHNRAIDSYRGAERRQSKTEVLDREIADAKSPQPEAAALAQSQADSLRLALGRLPPAQAEVITLAFYGGLSHSEIATQLAIPPGTIKGRMRLGLQKMRNDIEMDR